MMILFWITIFLCCEILFGTKVPNCRGIQYYGTIGDLRTNQTAITISFDLNVEYDAENVEFPNLVNLSNFAIQNDANILHVFMIKNFYRYVDYEYLIEIKNISSVNSVFPYKNGVIFFGFKFIYFDLSNVVTITTLPLFIKDGFIFDGIEGGTLMDYRNNFKIYGGTCRCDISPQDCSLTLICNKHVARCSNSVDIEIPNKQDEMCVSFENNITVTMNSNNNETTYKYIFDLTVTNDGMEATLSGPPAIESYFYGPFDAKNDQCLWAPPGCLFPSTNFRYVIDLNVGSSYNMIVGEIIKRNGMYFKNDTHFFTKSDPCLTYSSGSGISGGEVEGYTSTFCCTKFSKPQFASSTSPATALTSPTSMTTSPPSIQEYRIAECTNSSIPYADFFQYKIDEVFIFQSLDYPQRMTAVSGYYFEFVCYKAFTVSDYSIMTNTWFALTNGAIQDFVIEASHGNYQSNSDIFTFSTTSSFIWINYNKTFTANYWTAFQAIVSAYDPDKNLSCPLSMKSFNLVENPGLIIPITVRYDNTTNGTDSCNWNFKINSEHQKLKVVIKKLILPNSFNLSLNADGKIVKIFNDTVNALPISYYGSNGSNFDFAFTNLHFSNSSNFEFFLLISAVERSPKFTNSGCQMTKNGTITTFTNVDFINGYPSNQRCEFDIEISPNCQSLLVVSKYEFESCCDVLSITYGKNESQIIEWDGIRPQEYLITDKIDNGKLIFESDGNTQQAGFIASLTEFDCVCPKKDLIVSCKNGIIIYPLPNNNKYYCDMMNCTYKILPNPKCPNISVSITPSFNIRPSIDRLILKNQGKLIAEYQNSTDSTNMFYYSAASNLSVNFVSKNSLAVKLKQNNWWISIKPISDYSVTTQFLSKTNITKSVLILNEMSQRSTYTVCAGEDGTTTLEMYMTVSQNSTNLLSSFLLYDSNILSNFIGSLDSFQVNRTSKTIPQQITSTSGCFSIFSLSTKFVPDVVLFQLTDKLNQQPSTNILQFSFESNNNTEISISSKKGESSETIFLVPLSTNFLPFIWISNISIFNASLIFECTANGNHLITVNDLSASQWNFGIYTSALSVILSPFSEATIQFRKPSNNNTIIDASNDDAFQKGIMASPSYCGIMQTFEKLLLYQTQVVLESDNNNTYFSFVLKDFYGNPNIILESDGMAEGLKNNSIINGTEFSLYFQEVSPQLDGFLIEYSMQKYENENVDSKTSKNETFLIIFSVLFLIFLFVIITVKSADNALTKVTKVFAKPAEEQN